MGARAIVRAVTVLCLAGFSLALWSGAASAAGECPNEARRKEQNARYLPDCRAYEMVSPAEKNGSDIVGANNMPHLSDSGDRASFESFAGFGEDHGSGLIGFTQYVTTRHGGEGWGTPFGVTPQPTKDIAQVIFGATNVVTFSDSLDKAFLRAYQLMGSTNPDLPHSGNFYVEDTETGALEAATTPVGVDPSTISPFSFLFGYRGVSADLGVVAFEGFANLMPELPFTSKLYAFNHGKLEVAGVLPDGSLPAGGSGGATTAVSLNSERMAHEVSRDGSKVLFRSPVDGSKPEQLYMRRNGTSTAWVSQSEASIPNPEPEGVEYIDTSADGKVLFGSRTPLTESDPGGAGWGLYVYTDSPNPETEQNLTFIARTTGEYANSEAKVSVSADYSGMSKDAKRVYFFSESTAALPQQGTYLWDEGTLHFVAPTRVPLSEETSPNSYTNTVARASGDGRKLAFLIRQELTEAPVGLDKNEVPQETMYLYDEASNSLRCVSCLPTGAPTSSPTTILPEVNVLGINVLLEMNGRFLSKDGRYVFFSTRDALVPSDVNGVEDTYEYDSQTGEVSLLSSGTDGNGSYFSDASPDGSNVLIVGRTSYLRQDPDDLIDVYDVRVNGGFVQPPPSTGSCVGDECQGVPSAAPSFNTASGFTGLGNVVHSSSGKAKPKSLTRAQKLRRALRACRRKHGKARHRCEARARRRYGVHKASKSTSRPAARG
jgi:hypothetical protein